MTSRLTAGHHVLVAGFSTRAAAESAARAGYAVTAVDAFADLDQHPAVRALAVSHGFSPRSVVRATRGMECNAVVYLSNFENHPDAVRALSCGRTIWGNSPDTLAAVRNPHLLAEALARHNLMTPALWGHGEGSWLLKPLASGGGSGITRWHRGTPVPEGHYVQEFIEGQTGSVVFVASGAGVRVLGTSRQLVGLDAFGAGGFRYCGSILDDTVANSWPASAATALATAVAAEFALSGVNGIDFVARDGALYPIEVNPRWTSSMELVERARGVSVFSAHAEACTTGELPAFDLAAAAPLGRSIGKAVLFARHDVTVGDTQPWCADGTVRDVPRPGTVIRTNQPVCTVFGEGSSPDDCQRSLEVTADRIFAHLRAWAGRSQ